MKSERFRSKIWREMKLLTFTYDYNIIDVGYQKYSSPLHHHVSNIFFLSASSLNGIILVCTYCFSIRNASPFKNRTSSFPSCEAFVVFLCGVEIQYTFFHMQTAFYVPVSCAVHIFQFF